MSDLNEDSALDRELAASAPATTANTVERSAALAEMARESAPTNVSPLRRHRPLIIGSAVGVAILGFGSAAVATGAVSVPWVQDVATEFTYTLPSGAECRAAIGDVTGGERYEDVLRDTVTEPGFFDGLDLETHIAFVADNNYFVHEDGTETKIGPDTPYYYSADEDYHRGLSEATFAGLREALTANSLDPYGNDFGYLITYDCPGEVQPEYIVDLLERVNG
ncbi:hypothetical protein [Demequina sediminicola]|uniref:hypothetical protein n=1 Tax=Demequina sediminicola TaxID=1095026 RepID=UPI0007833A4B|nr:hypothetical protein [Demequina sediminicola]